MVLPGADARQITTVHSHVHALGQCRKIIRNNKWTPKVAGDTAGAARLIKEMNDPTQAALSPILAAELYGLDIVETNVEDEANNVTRFVVLSRDKDWAIPMPLDDGSKTVTTFVFNVRNVPAALYKAMAALRPTALI